MAAPHPPLDAERFRELFADGPFDASVNDRLGPYYAEDVVFTDPIQTVRGRDQFFAMNLRLIGRARSIRFDVRHLAQRGDEIMAVWTMTMSPKPFGPTVTIDGVTHVTLRDGLVWRHTDYWDLLGSVMSAIPLVGAVYRAIVRQLG